eukprot:5027475-Prymnesium_polylepis.1
MSVTATDPTLPDGDGADVAGHVTAPRADGHAQGRGRARGRRPFRQVLHLVGHHQAGHRRRAVPRSHAGAPQLDDRRRLPRRAAATV